MINEIKEILDRLERLDHKEFIAFEFADSATFDEVARCFKERKKMSYYITNLQEENERLKEWKEDLLKENIELENTRKKAIEYINQNKRLSMFADCREPEEDWNYELEINPRDLLNILNGDDK